MAANEARLPDVSTRSLGFLETAPAARTREIDHSYCGIPESPKSCGAFPDSDLLLLFLSMVIIFIIIVVLVTLVSRPLFQGLFYERFYRDPSGAC